MTHVNIFAITGYIFVLLTVLSLTMNGSLQDFFRKFKFNCDVLQSRCDLIHFIQATIQLQRKCPCSFEEIKYDM